MPFDAVTLLLVAVNGAVMGTVAAIWLSYRPKLTAFVLLMAPGISSFTKENSLEGDMAEGTDIGGYIRVALLLLAGMAGLLAFTRSYLEARARPPGEDTHIGQVPAQFIMLGIFLAVALTSAAWSAAPFYTLVQSVTFLALGFYLLGVLAWSREHGLQDTMEGVFLFMAFWTVANLSSLVLFPDKAWWWNVPSRFQGLTDHPNTMGSFSMMAYPIFLWRFMRSEWKGRLGISGLILLAGAMQLMSGSRTSILGAGLGLGVWLLAEKRIKTLTAYAMISASGIGMLLVAPPESMRREEFADESVTLTGRPLIWNAGIRLIALRPLNGYGYAADSAVMQDPELQRLARVRFGVYARHSMHNGYLSLLMGVGAIGFLLWLGALLYPYFAAWLAPPTPERSALLAILTMAIATNFVETLITGGSAIAAIIVWLAWAASARIREQVREEAAHA